MHMIHVSFIPLYSLRLLYFAERTGDLELHIYFNYKWFTCFMLLVSSHDKGYFNTSIVLLKAHKIFIDSHCKDGYPGSCGKFEEKCKNMIHSRTFFCISWFWGRYKLPFLPKTLHVRVALNNNTCLWWCQAISSKSKCQIRMFPLCFPNFFW